MTEPIWPNKKDISIHKQYPTRRELYEQGFDYGFNESIDACKLAWEQSPKPRPVVTVEEVEKLINIHLTCSLNNIPREYKSYTPFELGVKVHGVNNLAQALINHLGQGE